MGRTILAVLAGIAVMWLSVPGIEFLSHAFYPPPPGFSATDRPARSNIVAASTPAAMAMATLVLAWTGAAFSGSFIAAGISWRHKCAAAFGVGSVAALSLSFMLLMLPNRPTWVLSLGTLPILMAFLAGKTVEPTKKALLKALEIKAWPDKTDGRRQQFIRAFERLLLVSTSGAFFFALVRNVPVHAQEIHLYPDWAYTFDRILRYLSLTWFLAYFFVSSVNNDQSTKDRKLKDVLFDILQAVAVLCAIYGLGFVLPDRGFGFDDGLSAFCLSNATVTIICSFSLLFFRSDDGIPAGLNRVRFAGFYVGLTGTLVALCAPPEGIFLFVLLFLQGVLWLLWYAYFRIRLDQAAPTSPQSPG